MPPAALNFLAGLCAGAGINMLTSVAMEPGAGAARIIVDSALWVLAATLLTVVAAIKSAAEAEADRADNPKLSARENQDSRKEILAAPRVRIGVLTAASAVALVAAALYVPNLIPWKTSPAPAPSSSPSPIRGR